MGDSWQNKLVMSSMAILLAVHTVVAVLIVSSLIVREFSSKPVCECPKIEKENNPSTLRK